MKIRLEIKDKSIKSDSMYTYVVTRKLLLIKWIKVNFNLGLREAKYNVIEVLCMNGFVEFDMPHMEFYDYDKIRNKFNLEIVDNVIIGPTKNELREAKLARVLGHNDKLHKAIISGVEWQEYLTDEDEDNLTITEAKKKIIEQIYNKYKF